MIALKGGDGMMGVRLQVSIPEMTSKSLNYLVEKLGYTKSQIVTLAVDKMARVEKGESSERK